jgi:hypothetical protein
MSIQSFINQLLDLDFQHAIRLIIIIGGYWFLRTQVSKFLATRQLKQQLEEDQVHKSQENIEKLVEKPEDEQSWGWGKSTRKRVKRQEKLLQEALEDAQNGADDDKDIEELLE